VTIAANVKPVPAYIKRIKTADITRGESNDAFQIWPTARPAVSLEPGERLNIALRIRPLPGGASGLKLGANAPESWKLRQEANGDYWLDIPVDAATGSKNTTVTIERAGGRDFRIQLMVTVPSENLVVTPREIDFGDKSLSSISGTIQRLGVRKLVGSFHIKALSATIPFLKLQQATMVDGSNYLIRISVDSTKPLKPGAYEGVVVVETDEGHRVEVPVKIKLLE